MDTQGLHCFAGDFFCQMYWDGPIEIKILWLQFTVFLNLGSPLKEVPK